MPQEPVLEMRMRFTCDECGKESSGEAQNKFIMRKGAPSEPSTCCAKCGEKIDKHNAKFLKPMEAKEEKERAERKRIREEEAAQKKEAKEAEHAPMKALLEQNAQILNLLSALVQKSLAVEQKPDDKPRPQQRKPRAK